MTVASETTKASYSGDGSTVTFAVPFYFLAAGDLLVTRRAADSTETTLALTTDYSVSGAGNPAGGSITCVAAPTSGTTLVITRHGAMTQGLSLPSSSIFPAASVEQELDRLTMLVQQLGERIDRRPGLLVSTAATTPKLDDPVANRALVYNSDGTRITPGPTTTDISNAQTYSTNAAASAATATTQAGLAATSAASAAALAAGITDTSATSTLIGSGSKSITVSSGKQFAAGQFISIVSRANNANFMHGQVTSYSGTVLVVNVTDIGGSGTYTDWNVSVAGSQGSTGPTGPTGTVPIAAAGGSADAITGSYSPNLTLSDKVVCVIVPGADNATTTPTFSPDSLTAHTITKNGGAALVAGDVKALRPALLEYNLANTRWELMNPVFPPAQTGDVVTAGAAATIQSQAVTYAKVQNVSATSRVLGRKTAGAGSTEECTLSQILDFIGSAAQGDILYRDSGGWARLPAGTSGNFLKSQGAAANPVWAAATGGAVNIQSFTSAGANTWTKPASGTWAYVQAWGGGGSGGCTTVTTSRGGGGGGGGYSDGWFLLSALGATETVTIGAGGASVATASNGNPGGNSTFGTRLTGFGGGRGGGTNLDGCGGGGGGVISAGVDANGATGGGGGSPLGGVTGTTGADSVMGGGGGAGNGSAGGAGGSSVTGGGGGGGADATLGAAGAAGGSSIKGGGGGGACAGTGTGGAGGASKIGGAGGAGGNNSGTGTAGSQPGGGGGGGANSLGSGKGGDGQIIVMVF